MATDRARLRAEEVGALDREAFVARFGGLFEGSPWIAEAAWATRPWPSRRALHAALLGVVRGAGRERQLGLIRAHPDLVGRAALAGTLTRDSTGEQRAAGLDPGALTAAEVDRFARANAAYLARFGFPFVVCARENTKAAILDGFDRRLANAREAEVETALAEIAKIGWHRLADLVAGDDGPAPYPTERSVPMPGYDYEISYGKLQVPVYRVFARPLAGVAAIPESPFVGRSNTLFAAEVDVEVYGDDFLPAYTHGDNATVVATDSMKNFIIRETLTWDGATLESLLWHLAHGFTGTYEQLRSIRLTARERPFVAHPVPAGDGFAPSDRLYDGRRGDYGTATLRVERDDASRRLAVVDHECGRVDLRLLKITGSAFTAFVRDEYTTLPDRKDRPLYISLDVRWRYADPTDGFPADSPRHVPSEQVRDLVATTFHDFVSESIQHLMHEMGVRLLDRFPQLAEVSFAGQNRTPDPHATAEDDDAVRVYSEPFPAFGSLKLRMRRA